MRLQNIKAQLNLQIERALAALKAGDPLPDQDEHFEFVVGRLFMKMGIEGPNGLRAFLARAESNALTEQDREFLESLPKLRMDSPLTIARYLVELEDEV